MGGFLAVSVPFAVALEHLIASGWAGEWEMRPTDVFVFALGLFLVNFAAFTNLVHDRKELAGRIAALETNTMGA